MGERRRRNCDLGPIQESGRGYLFALSTEYEYASMLIGLVR